MTKYNVSVIGTGEEVRVDKINPAVHAHRSGRLFTKEELAGFDTVKETK
jgi:hypothetical protein